MATATPSRAALLNFDFSSTGNPSIPGTASGTVTGELDELMNNIAKQPAAAVIQGSHPSFGSHSPPFPLRPCDPLADPFASGCKIAVSSTNWVFSASTWPSARAARFSGRHFLAGGTFGRPRQLVGMAPFQLGQIGFEGLVLGSIRKCGVAQREPRQLQDRLSGLRPAFAQSQDAGA